MTHGSFLSMRFKTNLFYEETPSYGPIPHSQNGTMAKKTPGELEMYIGAERVRTIKQEKELCLWCVQRVHL